MADGPIDLASERVKREYGDYARQRDRMRIDQWCHRWGLCRHPGTLAAFRMADPLFDAYPGRISETTLANEVFFYHRFYLRFHFNDIDLVKLSQAEEQIGDRMSVFGHGKNMVQMFEDYEFDHSARDDWYLWAANELGLTDASDWDELDAAMREMAVMHGLRSDDDHGRAALLCLSIKAIRSEDG